MTVWIDTDMGADDLFAILTVARHRRVAGLSLSFGCAELPQVERNAAGAAQAFGWTFPLRTGAPRPILGPVETAERILGPSGMRSRGATLPDASAEFPPALPALADWIGSGGEVLALGPLTNLATVLLAHPGLPLDRITWMGGSTGRGNHTAFAEYNALADPGALAILLDRGVTVRMIDLEACRKVQIDETHVARLAGSDAPHAALLTDLMGGYLDIALTRGRPSMGLYDPVAAVAVSHPDLFRFTPVRIEVDLSPTETRARTAVVDGPPNAEVATDLDADAICETCLAALEAA